MTMTLTRRAAIATLALLMASTLRAADDKKWTVATFTADVTIPLGHACMGGGISPAKTVADPLFATGVILTGAGQPLVVVSVDWCEIRNDAYAQWQQLIADAVGTTPQRVLVSSIHQHDAPVADLEAERLLRERKLAGSVCDPAFHEKAVRRVASAARAALKSAQPITHIGMGQAEVHQVASNRRYVFPDGKIGFSRTSTTANPKLRELDGGLIDPYLKTLSFWNGDQAVAALSFYATHPMSSYGRGAVSADFPGLARKRRQADDPRVFQIYLSGCSGNVTAGKYNDGSPGNRDLLADRLYQAMVLAWKSTKRAPLQSVTFRAVPLRLEPRGGTGFTVDDLTKKLQPEVKPFAQCLAAMGLSWRKVADAGHKIDVPVIDFGPAVLMVLPGESYVEYQLLAQKTRPDLFVCVAGYGECATGYVPTDKAVQEHDGNLSDWCWVEGPGAEKAMTSAIEAALKK
jgi:hypothetical protein